MKNGRIEMGDMKIHDSFITDPTVTMKLELNAYLGGFLYNAILEDIYSIAELTDDQLSRSLPAITTDASLEEVRNHFYKAKLKLLDDIVKGDMVGCLVYARGVAMGKVPANILMELDRIHGLNIKEVK
ncbi:MAG: hypothetical protein ACRC92_17270 [Peptostreptococcaceae bacterium]